MVVVQDINPYQLNIFVLGSDMKYWQPCSVRIRIWNLFYLWPLSIQGSGLDRGGGRMREGIVQVYVEGDITVFALWDWGKALKIDEETYRFNKTWNSAI